jgi:hypothetical protein
MDRDDFESLVRAAQREHSKAIAAAEETLRRRLDAIKATMELAEISTARREAEGVMTIKPRGSLVWEVKTAVSGMGETFTLRDVINQIRDWHNGDGHSIKPKSVSAALKRLVGKQLAVVENGSGKRGTNYRKVTT